MFDTMKNRDLGIWLVSIAFATVQVLILASMGMFAMMGFAGSVVLTVSFLGLVYVVKRWLSENW